ncbi:glycosyltransferase family 4 protein [Spirochaeta africana]|uniref:Glycosyltransferase n=1 Tax=Spirochaeta africana (strain ATCC 700263 / DSM 8902 / Z-7692) TaxID=889378 RepID=H9UF55_SPIAZ|nr:glycosyltransferase family 4 protein [Spirochaeta africana]AFG36148.1 glycosyltransferase [Spirochaeta africana DSM 8902]
MDILILNYEYPPLGGGAANATFNLVRELSGRSDLQVTVVTSAVGAARVEQPADNVTLHFLDIGKTADSLHYQSFRDLIVYAWRAWRAVRRLQKQQRFDVVHAFFGIPCGFVARFLGVPYIVSLRGSDVPGYSPRMQRLERLGLRRLSRWVWRGAAAVTVNSAGLGELAAQTLAAEYPVIPNGVDTDLFAPAAASARRPPAAAPEAGLRLVSTGRLIPRKGYHLLIPALRPQDSLVLIGDGPERAALQQLAAGKQVRFLGEQPREVIARELQQADAFVLPSANEGMSNSLLEAMAAGLPVVVTDVGGSRELVDGNGVVLPERSIQALQTALQQLSDMDLAAMGCRSREIALQFSWAAMAGSYIELYRAC